ncbi:MAG: hypothetical protein HKN82_06190 [Akkermansiaceae bacterium]|nr:hypothetical protein [Akkermansiaceae bacterium]
MTLLELTVVILVLLALIAALFVGANSWKSGSDRAGCIINQRHVQSAVRSYANMHAIAFGEDISPVNLETALIANGYFENYPECPGNGIYTRTGNVVPPLGELYMTCSLAVNANHEPKNPADW